MLSLIKIGKDDKRGLSNLVAYVLLIVITISLSVMVYGWLKFYVADGDVGKCPDNVNLIINSYDCAGGSLTVDLRNKGLFSVDGYVLRYHNRTDAEFGIYVLNNSGGILGPGDNIEGTYSIEGTNLLVDVQPFLEEDGDMMFCEARASQRVVCE